MARSLTRRPLPVARAGFGRVKFVDQGIGPREIIVVASDATPDRMGDIVEPDGAELANFRRNPVVLAQHDVDQPIGTCTDVRIKGGQLIARIQFPVDGLDPTSDQYCRLAKAGVLSAVSIGFMPLEWKPISGGGLRFTSWELLEISLVSVPANPSALIIQRGLGSTSERRLQAARVRMLRKRIAQSRPECATSADQAERLREIRGRMRGAPSAGLIAADAAFRMGRGW